MFENLIDFQKDNMPNLIKSTIAWLIDECFRFFLQIVNNDKMLGELCRILKAILPEEETREGNVSMNLPKKHTR